MSEKKAADSTTLAVIRDWALDKFATSPIAETITIATSDWSSLSCTKSVTGMTASKIVLVSPDPSSFTAYTDAGVRCSAQGNGTLSFACDSVPSSSVTVNVLILGEVPATATVTLTTKDQYNRNNYGSSVSGGGQYAIGDTITVTATSPAQGYSHTTFGSWQDTNGNILSSSTSYSFEVTGDITLVAVYNYTDEGGN